MKNGGADPSSHWLQRRCSGCAVCGFWSKSLLTIENGLQNGLLGPEFNRPSRSGDPDPAASHAAAAKQQIATVAELTVKQPMDYSRLKRDEKQALR